ncbi:MAG: 3-deoxy-D-manno-octulosonic acid transferase, partial [Primorskyibacter sp.]
DGSLKPIAPPLMADAGALAEVRAQIGTRRVWVLASSHPEDEALAFAAHRLVLAQDPQALLIVAPRVPDRRDDMARALDESGLSHTTRSLGQGPEAQVWLADTFGELGLWYRVAQVAYVGGSNSAVEGHNPWEPVILHCPVLHGPRTAHFTADYRELDAAGAARCATTPSDLAESVVGPGGQTPCALRPMAQATRCLAQDRMDRLDDLCHRLLDLIPDVVTSDQTS